MRLLDQMQLMVGMSLTSSSDRDFGATCVEEAISQRDRHFTERTKRLATQQVEHDEGRLDLKGAGDAFSLPPATNTREALLAEHGRIQRTIPILRRQNSEECARQRRSAAARLAQAKQLYRKIVADAKVSYANAVAGLLKVETQALELARKTYKDVTGAAATAYVQTRTALKQETKLFAQEQDEALADTTAHLNARCTELRQEVIALPIDRMFKRIDMGFLRMRKRTGPDAGMPLFAVFTDKQAEFTLTLKRTKPEQTYDHSDKFSASNKRVAPYYADFCSALSKPMSDYIQKHWGRTYSYRVLVTMTVSARFAGLIPQPVREKIRKARPHFDEILIVTEAPEWAFAFEDRTFLPVPVGDPLVIGAKSGLFWLIDSFDTTSAEEHVRREFTSDIKK